MRAASPTTPLPSTTAFSISISRNIASAIAFSLKNIVYMGVTTRMATVVWEDFSLGKFRLHSIILMEY